ncbi:MAG TPA: trypsin-like peptidase domain-containing protein [Candidatus Methylomirabilis sp.]|nr:trypsin-like peptidase domain-containing protein [Candidatus Methylomirabilis sp.]
MQERGGRVVFAAGLLAGLLLGLLLAFFAWPHLSSLLVVLPTGPASRAELEQDPAFIRLAERVTPAVVNIRAQSLPGARRGRRPSPIPLDPFFRDFFERAPEGGPREEQTSLGSGVIIDKRGFVLTNNHVIKEADTILVRLATRKEYPARVIGQDSRTDVAVIRVETDQELPEAHLGDSDSLRVGEWAVAIGNPFGLNHTLTVGVVSATGRSDVGITSQEDFVQTDASINPGNSGGPLLNIRGEVIGINTAIVASGQGIGFAIPINLARKVAQDLIREGRVTQGWLGAGLTGLTREAARGLGVEPDAGVLVEQVLPGGPAEAAGIRAGDVIAAIRGRRVRTPGEVRTLVAEAEVGKPLELTLLRDSRELRVAVIIRERPIGPAKEGS